MRFLVIIIGYLLLSVLVYGSLASFVWFADLIEYYSYFDLEDLMYIYFAFSAPSLIFTLFFYLFGEY